MKDKRLNKFVEKQHSLLENIDQRKMSKDSYGKLKDRM